MSNNIQNKTLNWVTPDDALSYVRSSLAMPDNVKKDLLIGLNKLRNSYYELRGERNELKQLLESFYHQLKEIDGVPSNTLRRIHAIIN